MSRCSNPCIPLKAPQQALSASLPRQVDMKLASQPRLLPWLVELPPWPSATQP